MTQRNVLMQDTTGNHQDEWRLHPLELVPIPIRYGSQAICITTIRLPSAASCNLFSLYLAPDNGSMLLFRKQSWRKGCPTTMRRSRHLRRHWATGMVRFIYVTQLSLAAF